MSARDYESPTLPWAWSPQIAPSCDLNLCGQILEQRLPLRVILQSHDGDSYMLYRPLCKILHTFSEFLIVVRPETQLAGGR